MSIKPIRVVLGISIALVGGSAAGYFLGKVWIGNRTKDYVAERQKGTNAVLSKMGTLEIGDTLIDHKFEDLNGMPVHLSEVVDSRTIISIMSPGCGACIDELRLLREILPSDKEFERFVVISSGNPRLLQDIRDELNVPATYLYDHRKKWLSNYDVDMFPFNISVDSGLVVMDVVVGGFVHEDIVSFLDETSD